MEAIRSLDYKEARLDIVKSGVGAITEGDMELAKTAEGLCFDLILLNFLVFYFVDFATCLFNFSESYQ